MDFNGVLERILARRWIAGPSIEDALLLGAALNFRGVNPVFNYLGEDFTSKAQVADAMRTYKGLIREIKAKGLAADISVKPTQLGLLMGYQAFFRNYMDLVRAAKKAKVFVWLDMEEDDKVDDTIRAYLPAIRHGNAGICIQAALRRSEKDIASLARKGAVIRLVKGAYTPGADVAFQTREETTINYIRLMRYLFKKSTHFMVATHDAHIIEMARAINLAYKRHVTYAMLNGIMNRYAVGLARTGEKVSLYVPFGRDWMAYSYRRIREAGHYMLLLRSLLEDQSI